MNYITVGMGLITGNFIYQLMTEGDYSTAIERSFFQLVAISFLFFVNKKYPEGKNS